MDWNAALAGDMPHLDGTTGVAALDALPGCPQTARYHAEGDVAIHSMWTAAAAEHTVDTHELVEEEAALLRIAALLHDVGKPATTVEVAPCEYSAPRHAERGAQIVSELFDATPQLRACGVEFRAAVVAAVRAHMWGWHPDQVSVGAVVRTAHLVDLNLLAALWSCDGEGRLCDDQDELADRVEYARALFDEHTYMVRRDPWPHIDMVTNPYQLEPSVRRSVLRAVVRGEVTNAGAAAAHIAAAERNRGTNRVLWMCGISGSGKSTYAQRWADQHDAVVLTVAGGRRRDRDKTRGQNRQKLTELVRAGANVVVDATHVDRNSRDRLIDVADTYGARLDCVYVDTPLSTCIARQKNRPSGTAVPTDTIRSMAAAVRFPTPDEYDTLTVVDSTGEHLYTPETRSRIGTTQVWS